MLDSVTHRLGTVVSALTVSQDPEQSWNDLVRFWEGMEWPEGSKVEIIEGIITVSPAPAYRHNVIAARIQRRLYSVIPDDWEIFQTLAIAVPSRLGMLIPDLVVAPVREHTESDTHIPAALAELVVEVTSKSNARDDRVSEPAAYATAGIPLYLLVDRWAPDGPAVTLYGEPKGDVHRPLSTAKFGEPIKLPAPFDLVIDTGEFPEA
ncbi:Uma2 family endonuclease [Streptomyces capillispiralis]|uniref:Uma2 family endonuclease n=1 Tax=Streptomyces capillispiralis TaxID=68182 RepID=A0A561TES2_9ACTN|nr:Uma2 family endonuclease [Streptomyces capillispiralis]